MAARLSIMRAARKLAVEAGVHIHVRSFQVINQVGAASIDARKDCDAFASTHSATSHYDRASFVGRLAGPKNEQREHARRARSTRRAAPSRPARRAARHARQLCAHAARAAAPSDRKDVFEKLPAHRRRRTGRATSRATTPRARRSPSASARDPARGGGGGGAAAKRAASAVPALEELWGAEGDFLDPLADAPPLDAGGDSDDEALLVSGVLGMARCAGVFLDAGANRGDTLFDWYRAPACVDGPRLKTASAASGATVAAIGSGRGGCRSRRAGRGAPALRSQCQLYAPAAAAAAALRAELPAVASIAVHTSTAVGVGATASRFLGVDAVPGWAPLQLQRRAMDSGGRAGLGAPVGRITQRVRVVDAVRVVADLGARGVPVALKLDIEGTEYDVLRDLVLTGTLCRHVQTLWVEFHRPARPRQRAARRRWNGCCGRTMRRGRRFSAVAAAGERALRHDPAALGLR